MIKVFEKRGYIKNTRFKSSAKKHQGVEKIERVSVWEVHEKLLLKTFLYSIE